MYTFVAAMTNVSYENVIEKWCNATNKWRKDEGTVEVKKELKNIWHYPLRYPLYNNDTIMN